MSAGRVSREGDVANGPAGVLLRVLPPSTRPSRRARFLLERNMLVYRRAWLIILSGLFEPVFYLFSIGVGIGGLVGGVSGPGGEPISYTAFIAPALLAASAMNGAVFESTFNIFFKLKYGKIYDAVLSTPVGPGDIAVGEIAWGQVRGGLYACAFLVVMAVMDLIPSPLGILALPAALLIGFAFSAVGMAATTFMRSWTDFDLVTLVTLPLFLFSATFYPLEIYPPVLRPFVQLSPLYHGTELIRGLTLGIVDFSLVGHIAFLLIMGLAGLTVVSRRLERLLLS